MTNPNKRRGTAWESELVRYINERTSFRARRVVQRGIHDEGDIAGIPGVAIQAKDCARHDLSGWLDAAKRQATVARERWGIVIAKRRSRRTGEAYVVMRLDDFLSMIEEK